MNAVYYQAFLQSVEKWPKALCRSLLELTPRFGAALQDRAAWWLVVVRSTASGNEPPDATLGCVGAPAIPAADNRSAPNPPPTGRPDNPFYRGSVSCAARSRGEPDPPTSPRN